MPSAPQKRLSAKGRSAEMVRICTFGISEAFLLNVRVCVAHTEMSTEGNEVRITTLPAYSASETGLLCASGSVKGGAFSPTSSGCPNRALTVS